MSTTGTTAGQAIVAQWTGRQADALRLALRMTTEGFAGLLGVSVRTVAYWHARPEIVPRVVMQEALDTLLDRASAAALARFAALAGEPSAASPRAEVA
jgi:hypothetical protein